jgi:hypothetical protein
MGRRLPRANDVLIDETKVRDYLLSDSHPVGRFKARLFAAIGFDRRGLNAFVSELRRIAAGGEVGHSQG